MLRLLRYTTVCPYGKTSFQLSQPLLSLQPQPQSEKIVSQIRTNHRQAGFQCAWCPS